ncbi:serine hydrolase [Nocardiopsis sp. N85]|uniref:serine hydrolase domain-containing protein n=1 Tax=Nocardiopsis sp. N85 TaxID=3029400 RepID=UPI00237F9A8D|nr:serine hydrolase domain-containing protein [Nocardiopsis sp. N85]MDE3723773.1 serine hydrolase [Nocardiopsis sp. N85]
MFSRITITVSLATALVVPAPSPAFASPGAETPLTAEAVDAYVADYLDATPLPGAAVAVTRGTEVVRAGGYGVDSRGGPMSARTPMGTASVGKAFTAVTVMGLVEDGAIALDDPVVARLPEFAVDDPRGDEITVRQLLTHTSGMSDVGFREKSEPTPGDPEGAVARLSDAALVADPGAEEHYHNPNYHVLARMVEVVEGRPFAEVLDERVPVPLGMVDTVTVDTAEEVFTAGVASGHVSVLGRAVALPEPEGYVNGSGGMVSTADDMARWLIAQYSGGAGPDGGRVLSPGGWEATLAPLGGEGPGGDRALGWSVGRTGTGAPLISHGGIEFTYTAHQALLPESGVGIAVMTGTGLGSGDAANLMWGLVALAEGVEPPAPVGVWLLVVDVVLVVSMGVVVFFAVRGVRRAPGWALAVRGRRWRFPVGALGAAVVVAAALFPHRWISALAGGRDLTWTQALYTVPTWVVFLVATVVWAVRVGVLVRRAAAPAAAR